MIVADAGPLIAFSRIGRLGLLRQVAGELVVPEAVYEDVVVKGKLTEKQLGLTSEDVTLTSQPEPGGLALLGTALLGAAVFLRRTLAPSR